MRVSVVGGSGYVGGELLRVLLRHPYVEIRQVTSERRAGQWVHRVHPHLRGLTDLRFVPLERLEPCDVLILALPHGRAMRLIDHLAGRAERIIDCSADFRLRDPRAYERWYGVPHRAPDWLGRFVYGLPELNRAAIRSARYVSGVGCNAVAVVLAVWPLVREGLVDADRGIVAEVKVGSSEAGRQAHPAGHHPERSRAIRSYAPVGHRHTAEVQMVLGLEAVHLSMTAVETVRGALATCHAFLRRPVSDRDLWRVYRQAYAGEPFVRIVHERAGLYRHPDPKVLVGSNYADVGWAVDEGTGRVVAFGAIDNLMKGAAGNAVQCLNLMAGWDERTGLDLPGLHPV